MSNVRQSNWIRGYGYRGRLIVPITLLLSALSLACGPSKQAWQSQLDENARLNAASKNCQQELEQSKADAARLLQELQEQQNLLAQEKERGEALQQQLKLSSEQAAILERIKARFAALREKLKGLTELGLEVSIRHNKMVISLPGDVLFRPGSAGLSRSGKGVLAKVLKVLLSDKSLAERYYQVAGHTDNQPLVRTVEVFKDNWGLSLMRAREVLLYLTEADGEKSLDVMRWSAAGYADTDPVAQNITTAGRRRNRRVELVVQPDVEEMLDLKSLID